MENKEKIKVVVFAIACFAAVSIFAASHYQRRRRKQKESQNLCYLATDSSKPQNTFKRILADNSYTSFKHLNRNKEKALNSHPYEEEITNLLQNPQIEGFSFVNGKLNLEMSGSHIWIETKSQLEEVVKVLSNERVFGVDTEQHSLRSFLGFTALMQISTEKEDYLLDTIALHDEMGILSPVFADPSICKVFHGADNDVLWLQRDFHIYVVNLFDTAKACEVLSKPHKSLAYLLETYCGVVTNKLLQREDWRLRPLSGEMVQYARADAHYLLYIADCLTTELKAQDTENSACPDDKLHFVLEASRRSNMVCLQLYTKDIEASPGDSAASSILSRYLNGQSVPLDSQSKDLVARLCLWRDFMARLHDESLRFVLSDQAIAALASNVPKTLIEIYDTISEVDLNLDPTFGSSLLSPSPVVCSHLEDLCYLLQEKMVDLDVVFTTILQKHLGPDGVCPLSIYNYALLSKCNLKPTNGLPAKQNGGKASKRIGRKASRALFVQKFSCKSPVYHNCRIYASDGRLLCYCDRRKLEWYVRRDLAKLVDDNPPAIMLLFEPKGRPEDEDNDFYIQSKKNMCVGCGERNHYLRYRIIPSCYRMHFPEHLKSHRSHDIVLLCVDCHEIAHSAAEKHKRHIAGEFGIPLFVKRVVDSRQNVVVSATSGYGENHEQDDGVSPLQLRTAAMALLRYGPMMPSKRREELTQIVMKYFGGREISEADLESALLVGMSPHERRRLEKKKGISLKHSSEGIISNMARESTTSDIGASVLAETLTTNTKDGEQTPQEALCSQKEDINVQMDTDTRDNTIVCDLGVNGENSGTATEEINFDKSSISKMNTDEDYESRKPSDESDSLDYSYGTVAPNHNHKLSLLGHGPHGKQVVDYLLKEYGEDGIREFCQRWRQVFVEAVHPRFLPGGWDVKHSGRRDFGAYSVYNPMKQASDIVNA